MPKNKYYKHYRFIHYEESVIRFKCEKCNAEKGEICKALTSGRITDRPHSARLNAWRSWSINEKRK